MSVAAPPTARMLGAPVMAAPALSVQLIPVRASLPELVRNTFRLIGCPGAEALLQLSMMKKAGFVRMPQVALAAVLTGALLMDPLALQVMVSVELLAVGT